MRFLFVLFLVATASASTVVVLPERFAGNDVVVQNSAAYKDLVKSNRTLTKQLEVERKDKIAFALAVDTQLRAKDEELQKLRAATSKPKIPFWNILGLAIGFISNPFGFIVTRLVELALALVAAVLLFIALRWAWRKYRI